MNSGTNFGGAHIGAKTEVECCVLCSASGGSRSLAGNNRLSAGIASPGNNDSRIKTLGKWTRGVKEDQRQYNVTKE